MAATDRRLFAAIGAALLVHAGLGAGLHAANEYLGKDERQVPMEVTIVEPPPPPPEPPPPPPEPPPPEPAKSPPPPPKVKKETPPPPRPEEPPPVAPPPEPPSEPAPEAPAQKIYTMPGPGTMVVPAQPAEGSAHGRPKTSGTEVGGSQTGGTGQAVSVAAIKTMPKPTGDYDYVDLGKDYPEAARRQGIEGEVTYRIFVDESGKVTQVKIVKRLGYGLDEKGEQLVRRIRFEPARDTNDRAVGVWRSWSIQFTLPR